MMERRDVLKMIAAASGLSFIGNVHNAFAWPQLSKNNSFTHEFSQADIFFFNEVAEVVIPRTDTPSAKDVNVGAVMAIIATDCYPSEIKEIFASGKKKIEQQSEKKFGLSFLALTPLQRFELISVLNEQAFAYNKAYQLKNVEMTSPSKTSLGKTDTGNKQAPHYFTLYKQLILFTFYTSDPIITKALRYVAIPGKFDGDFPYKKGDKAWATN